jgi:hypothetical protein
MSRLALCRVCRRHVRAAERACPFCARTRAFAAAAIGTTFAITGCGGTTDPGPTDASADASVDVAADVSFFDSSGFDVSTPDAQPDSGGVALYGAPPPIGSERVKKTE